MYLSPHQNDHRQMDADSFLRGPRLIGPKIKPQVNSPADYSARDIIDLLELLCDATSIAQWVRSQALWGNRRRQETLRSSGVSLIKEMNFGDTEWSSPNDRV